MARSRQFPPSVDPGKPILPPPPLGWTTFAFGDVLEVVERPVQLADAELYQLVTAKRSRGGIVAREAVRGEEIKVKSQFEIQGGDFLISRRQIVHGACGLVPPLLSGAVVSNEYAVLRPKEHITAEYLDQLSHTHYFQRTCFHSSVGVDIEKMVFKLGHWLRYQINLPAVAEQCKISAILSAVGQLIEKTKSVVEHLQVFKKEITRELLSRGILGLQAQRARAESSDLPQDWEMVQIGKIAAVGNGSTPSKAREDYWRDGDIPWLPTGKVNDKVITSADTFVTQKALAECPIRLLPPGTVLVAMIGQGKTRGKVAYLSIEACINQNFAFVLPSEKVRPWFLYYYLDSQYEALRSSGRGSNQDAMNCGIIKRFPVLLPSLEEQDAIVLTLSSIQSRIQKEEEFLEALAEVRQALSSALLSGEIRITPDPDPEPAANAS